MIARMFIFSCMIIFSQNHRATIVRERRSYDVRKNIVRRSLVINVRIFIVRTSRDCRANVVQHVCELELEFAKDSCDNRTTFVRLSQIFLNHPFSMTGCKGNVAFSVANMILKIVHNCRIPVRY